MKEILKFQPIFKSVIWGGSRIASFKGLPSQGDNIGESWELSPVRGFESVVAQGTHKGSTLPSLLAQYGNDIMGERLMKRFDGNFPLLIKIIDSADDLSVQVHPDDALAAARHNSLGKTEMWYSIAPDNGAYLYSGFSRRLDETEFRREVAENEIVSSLRKYYTRPGDVFFLPAGRVHSIGRGNLVLEIQEASDITYRIYDYDRRDASGKPRQLHVDESIAAINFDDCNNVDIPNVLPQAGKTQLIEKCNYFTAEITDIDRPTHIDLTNRDSFTVLFALSGEITVGNSDTKVRLRQGETALVPASCDSIDIEGSGSVISIYIE